MKSVYLDHNATTPLDERVFSAMLPFLQEHYGNPSSGHRVGLAARTAISRAREQVAALVHAHPTQVIFTSGGTEANNLAIKGVMSKLHRPLLISSIEHASVASTASALAKNGAKVLNIGVNSQGQVTDETLHHALSLCEEIPAMVSVMSANNETGVLQDITLLAQVLKTLGVKGQDIIFHTDAVQLAGKADIDFGQSGAHMMSLSAHKMYGPKGVGALVVDKAIDKTPLLHGGHQEAGQRAGTENVAGIVGFGVAAELALRELDTNRQYLEELRKYLESQISSVINDAVIFCKNADRRLSNTVFLSVPGIDGETLLMALDQYGIAVSSGSACETDSIEPNKVLLAMNVRPELARGAIRISLGKANNKQEIDYFIRHLKAAVDRLKRLSAMVVI